MSNLSWEMNVYWFRPWGSACHISDCKTVMQMKKRFKKRWWGWWWWCGLEKEITYGGNWRGPEIWEKNTGRVWLYRHLFVLKQKWMLWHRVTLKILACEFPSEWRAELVEGDVGCFFYFYTCIKRFSSYL